ncbi:hypothetical protein BLNAU_4224 [Blattamonas nauphoetae]|uniref:Protein kinase domain-containing protein n=1 Tax=Blattamonas nauphoetae TaxID=2049346 RepID=A0ABQ9YAM1_9EUKA|nr:hypothetical protein BLNAU_4224 [Blattamonas nauphoetae]
MDSGIAKYDDAAVYVDSRLKSPELRKSSPFIVMKSILNRGSSVRLVSTTHKTSSSSLLPFVGICPSFLDDAKNSYPSPEHKDISIIGESISLNHVHLVKGSGPLFAFGLGDTTPTPTLLGQQLATTLTSASLVNVTSSPIFKSSDYKTFGSLLSQMTISCEVSKSTNHDCGTLFLDPNLGGNVVCVNSSFSSCVRQANTEALYTHRNMTQSESHTDRIVFDTSSTATSVTVTSCTFNTMSVGFGRTWQGGAAIFLYASLSSLNISQCCFHKCSVTKADDDGGAVLFYCTSAQMHQIDVSSSSFTECTTPKISTNAAGGIIIGTASSATIQNTIFERCDAQFDASIYVISCSLTTITNCMFLSCEGDERAGGIGCHSNKAIDYSYLHFRDCTSPLQPYSKDIYITTITKPTTVTVQYCDSTSGAPNVFDYTEDRDASDLVPQLTSTPTVTGATVSFSADKQTATVTVTTEQALNGTMGVLLDGSNVPRMVYVVFGTSTTVSHTGMVTVSSGPDGVLPEATYVHRASAIPGNVPKQVHHTSTALSNPNTTTIALSGYGFENGDYVMTIDNDGTEQNITLAWMDANTLSGSAPLYPFTAPGRLDYGKIYPIIGIIFDPMSKKENVRLIQGNSFTTPTEPSRVTDADCSLNGKKDGVVVRLIGTKLFSNGQKVKMGSEGLIESTGTIFGVLSTECFVEFSTGWFGDGRQTIFGNSYEIFSVGSGSDSFVVNSGVSFAVPSPPLITTISAPSSITSSSFTLSFRGSSLPSGSTYTVTLNTSDTFDVTFSSETLGLSSTVMIGVSEGLKYATEYSIVSMIKTEEDKPDEHILLSSSSFTTPIGPSLSLVASSLSPSNANVVRLSLSTILMPSEQFTLVLTSITSPSKTVSVNITFSSTQPASPPTISTIDVEVYNQTNTLEYNTAYSIKSMTSSNVVAVVTAPVFTTPNEPPRVQSFENSRLSLDRTELSFELVGRALKTGLSKVALKREGFLLESVSPIGFINDTHSSVKFLVGETESSSRLAYGTEYTLTTVEGDVSGLVVDPGIIVRAPNPAKVTKMEIDFSNSAKTGCIVRLSGADLVPGTIYSATLSTPQQPQNRNSDSSSISFDISFSSTAEGVSQPIKIGWKGENNLEYSMKYTLTSLTPSVAEDGAIIFDSSLSDTTGTKPAESFFYVDSLSSDSSPFCGDRDSPCQSIDSAWMIVLGVSLTRPTLGIVDLTTLSTPISISNNMHVVIMNGTSSEPKLNVSFVTSQSIDADNTMITVKDSFLELLNVDVVLASLSQSFVFVSASDSTIVFRDGSFLGSTSPPTSTQNEADSENLCSWSSGIIQIADCTTSITNTQLTHLVFGAINMKGGDLTIQTTTFSDNSPSNSSFPSASRNIHCSENGKIEIVSLNGGDGFKTGSSAWISSEDCVLSGRDSTPKTPLFIPTLNASKSTSTRDKKAKTIKFTIIGTMLIPCGLLVEVFEWNADTQTEGTRTIVELNENTNLWTEEQIDGIIDETKDLLNLSETSDWRLRLVFGDEVRTDTSIVLRTVASDRKALFGQAVKWMIPLIVAVVLIALFFIILLIVLLRRRKKGKQKQSELKEIDEFVEEMKIEDPTMEGTDRLNCSAFDTPTESNHNNTHITARNETEKDQKFEEDAKEDQAAGEFALVTLSNGSEVRILKKDTLYNRLHNPQMKDTHLDFDSVRKQIISGLLDVRKRDRSSAILLQLSPHLVFFDAAGVACLNCSQHPQSEMEIVGRNGLSRMGQNQPQDLLELPDKQNQLQMETANNEQDNAVQATEGTTLKTLPSVNLRKVNEGDRWRAPEVTRMIEEYAQNGSHTQTELVSRHIHLDHSAAAVFSLGLILWEIETNQIPFGEVDAVNAQRQLGSGQRPGMEKVHSEWMASVIEQCLEYEPAKRIKLEHLESLLCGPSQHKPSQPFALDQVPFVNHHELQPLP